MITIDGKTRTCGLIGNPVGHTLSPVIHNNLAEKMGQNLVYLPFLVDHDVKAAIEGAYALNVLGLNVTVPYKHDVMPYLVDVDEAAKRIGAVNTLVRKEGGYKGYNTDYLGLKRAMEEDHISLAQKTVVILGAGGAAMSIAYLCAQEQAKELYIVNRTIEKAENIAQITGKYFPSTKVIPMRLSEYQNLPDTKLIVIQTTSIGLYPNIENSVIEDENFFEKVTQAVDIIYNPEETKFMNLVRQHGGQAYNGLKMLLYQGIIAYELWNDCQVSSQVAADIYELLKKEFENR